MHFIRLYFKNMQDKQFWCLIYLKLHTNDGIVYAHSYKHNNI